MSKVSSIILGYAGRMRSVPSYLSPKSQKLLLTISRIAVVTLTPIGAPYELERVFSLNLVTEQVGIGRASRNPAKGLTAAGDNAWFDSPIMSRQHAKFSLPSLWGNVSARSWQFQLNATTLTPFEGHISSRLRIYPWDVHWDSPSAA